MATYGILTSCAGPRCGYTSLRRSDSGGASFLGDVWAAMQEWRESRVWRPVSVPALDLQHYEATFAVGGPAELRPPSLPERPPLVPDSASSAEVR